MAETASIDADNAISPAKLTMQVADLHRRLWPLLEDAPFDGQTWRAELDQLADQLLQMTLAAPDAMLYLASETATRQFDRYSSRHALHAAVVAGLCAATLQWPAEERRVLVLAALTMNVGMTTLQNELMHRERTPTLDQRALIDRHPQVGRAMLAERGVADALWLDVVALHHGPDPADADLGALSPAQRLARLLRRVDVYTAKLSSRRVRAALPATHAARDACLGPDGRPDTIGAAMIRTLGIYPPGSMVQLADGRIAMVVRRGTRAHQPLVVVIADARRRALLPEAALQTSDAGSEVKAAARSDDVKVALNHERILALAAA